MPINHAFSYIVNPPCRLANNYASLLISQDSFRVSRELRFTACRIASAFSTPYFRGVIPHSKKELDILRLEQAVFLRTYSVKDYLNTFRQTLFSLCMHSLNHRKELLTVQLQQALDDLLTPGCARACVYTRK